MEDDDTLTTANSELRFITLELMRLAQKSGRSFPEVADEFISNTVLLQELISGEASGRRKAKARKGTTTRQK